FLKTTDLGRDTVTSSYLLPLNWPTICLACCAIHCALDDLTDTGRRPFTPDKEFRLDIYKCNTTLEWWCSSYRDSLTISAVVYIRYMKTVNNLQPTRRNAILAAYSARVEERFKIGKHAPTEIIGYQDEMGDDISDLPGQPAPL